MQARFAAPALALALVVAACSGTAASDTTSQTAGASTDAPAVPATAATPEPTPSSASRASDTPATAPTSDVGSAGSCRDDVDRTRVGRTDVRPSGNRQAAGSLDLLDAPVSAIALPAVPTWVVPYVTGDDCASDGAPAWYVVLDDGNALIVSGDGTVTEAGDGVSPPESRASTLRTAYDDLARFDEPLADSRVVSFGVWTAALVEPTDRYGHGVLGDRIEAAGVQIINTESGEQTMIEIEAPTVIEGISPMFIDVDEDSDGTPEVLVTLSNSDVGAWLALYRIDGTLRAESAPIGQGNRWRNQLGAGWTGTAFEIVDVRTPHLDGVVEFFRIEGDQLERTAKISGYTSHTIGSRNLDLGILVDADADDALEVVLATRDLQSLAVIDRVGDEAVELGRIDLGSSLSTNIASQWMGTDASLAVGTADGRLLVIGDPELGVND